MTSGTGTCSVRYDQAGSANYNAAPQVVENVAALTTATVPDAPTGVTASAGDGQATGELDRSRIGRRHGNHGLRGDDLLGGVAQSTKSVGVVTQTIGERV